MILRESRYGMYIEIPTIVMLMIHEKPALLR